MSPVTITLGTIGVLISVFCWWSFISGVVRMVRTIRLGQKDGYNRFTPFFPRLGTMLTEFIAHTRMVRNKTVGFAHWPVMIGFLIGFIIWFEAYIQTFNPHGGWPILKDWAVYHFVDEVLGIGTVIGIIVLITIRQLNNPNRTTGLSRFAGSDHKAAYFVEIVVLLEGLGMVFVKAGKLALERQDGHDFSWATDFLTGPLSTILPANELMVSIFALIKLLSGMIWLYVVGRNITWGVAWHRFAAFFNIYFKREDSGRTALGAAKPMTMNGEALTMEKVEELTEADENFEPQLGVGAIEDFSWKGWLDFTTCTECGRCQSQCPAWNTGKPLSPKLLIMSLRDHGYAKAPYLLAGGKTAMGEEVGLVDAEGKPNEAKLSAIPEAARLEAQRPLVGDTVEGDLAASGIIDPEVLWSCTNCGACVEQCPVDIEHVDHIIDMRRYQVLLESEFPSELAGLFKNLENKGNPWGQNQSARLDWAKDLSFDVPVVGTDVADFGDTEYLFWVGCAGAFEDRAKKTTQAVATLLHTAGVKFAVLGQGETCTGDSARRAGNEFLFQMLAEQNIDTLNDAFDGVAVADRKIVVTCAHCLNTLKNEYGEFGGTYTVVHHTQLLNRLVREKRLVPVAPVDGTVTYHDPCFLGRHNHVYQAPRELMDGAGARLQEMPRHGQRSMCCGAGGARMWMEETIGKRINIDRVDEALSTNPTKIATGCPFCRVMLADGTTAQTDGTDREGQVEVVDVSQLLLESVSRNGGLPEPREPEWLDRRSGPSGGGHAKAVAAGAGATAAGAAAATATATLAKDKVGAPAAAKAPATSEAKSAAPAASTAAESDSPVHTETTSAPAPGAAQSGSGAPKAGAPKAGAPKAGGGLSLGGKAAAPGTSKAPAPGGTKAPAPAGSKATAPAATKDTQPSAAASSSQDDVPSTPATPATPAKGAPKAGGGLALGGKAKAPGSKAPAPGSKAPVPGSKAPAPGASKHAESATDAGAAKADVTQADESKYAAPKTEAAADAAAQPTASSGGAPKSGAGLGLGLGGKAPAPGARKDTAPATDSPAKDAEAKSAAKPTKADAPQPAEDKPAAAKPTDTKPAASQASGSAKKGRKAGGYGLSLG